MPRWPAFAGSRKAALEPMGLTVQTDITRVLNALRADADWLRNAIGPDQRGALEDGEQTPDLRRETIWEGTPEGEQALRQERLRLLEQYRQEWGEYPA